MIREYFFQARRGEGTKSPPFQILHASMGSLRLITPGGVIRGLRSAGSAIGWVVFILLLAVFPFLFDLVLDDPTIAALVGVAVLALGTLIGFFVYRGVMRYSARHPVEEVALSVRDARVRRWFHELTVEADEGAFVLKVQGRQRALLEALTLAGHPVVPRP